MKKQPKQKRSLAIVEAILDASTRVLTQNKLSQMTTNKVADIAGVSIGSLYDYFPNKNSIVVALMDKRMQKHLDEFFAALDAQTTIEGLIAVVGDMIENEYLAKRAFLREVFILAPENGRMEALFLNRLKAQKELEKFFIEKIGRDADWARRKSFVLIHAAIGLLESYVIMDEIPFAEREFRNEMVGLMRAVLAESFPEV